MLLASVRGAIAAALISVALPGLSAADWPQWRGPNRDGISTEAGTLTPWSGNSLTARWRAQVGTGFSSIAVNRGRLYTLGNRDNIDTVYCLEAAAGRLHAARLLAGSAGIPAGET